MLQLPVFILKQQQMGFIRHQIAITTGALL